MKPSPVFRKLLMAATLVAVMGIIALVGFQKWSQPSSGQGNLLAENATNALPQNNSRAFSVGDTDRAAVLAAFKETDPARRSLAFTSAFAAWFERDPEAALDWLRQMPQGMEYTQGLFIALPKMCATDPQRALLLAASMATTHEQKFIYNVLFDQLGKSDLASAIGWLRSAPSGPARENALRAVADNWSVKDTRAALDWAKNLEDAGERSVALESVLLTLATRDARQAIQLASENLAGDASARVLQQSLKSLAATDLAAAAELVGQLPEGDLQQKSALTVVRALAAEDPVNTAAWVQTLPASTQAVALNNTLDMWLRQHPESAGRYVSEMSPGSIQTAAISHLAENWAEKDPAAAVNWAASLSNASAQDVATISLASGWARIDPAAAVRWAAELPAENSARLAALKGAYTYWELGDNSAAETFLETLSEADRSVIKPAALAQK